MKDINSKTINNEFESIANIFKTQTPKKTTAHEWQSFALKVINELNIPGFKRGAVFRVCKIKPKAMVERCMNDTKELCHTGEKWKYFFKLIGGAAQKPVNYNFKK